MKREKRKREFAYAPPFRPVPSRPVCQDGLNEAKDDAHGDGSVAIAKQVNYPPTHPLEKKKERMRWRSVALNQRHRPSYVSNKKEKRKRKKEANGE